jgi:hypothetical protein
MSTPAPAPSPNFTPLELIHFRNLETLFDSLNTAARDPATPVADLPMLLPRIDTVAGEIQEMNAIAFGRDTVDLKAEAEELRPANADLKQLKLDLAGYAEKTAALQKVSGDLDLALASAQALGI